MMGKDVSREHFRPRTCSGKNAPKTGEVKGNLKNVVYIDVDSDQFDDVVIIECPEFVPQKFNGSCGPSRDRTWTPRSVISIDDDDDDESDEADRPGIDAEGVGELDSDASSSKRFSSASNSMRNYVHIDVDDSQVNEKDSVSNMQKDKEACSAKATERNHYGLFGSESESSESDCSDCELMEREQWEKFSAKKKRRVFNDQSCHDEHAGSSGFHNNVYIDIEVENRSEPHAEDPAYSGPSNGQYVKENHSPSSVKDDSQVDGINYNLETENSFKDSDQKVEQENFKSSRSESLEEMHSFRQSSDIEHGERTREKISPCPEYKNCNFCSGNIGASRFKKELGGEESILMSTSLDACERQVDNNGSALWNKDDNLSEVNSIRASFDERHVNGDGLVLLPQDGGLTASNERDIINEREKLKETDEYKQAMEEEWASRQQQLQIQAEEAQRLRKRKKAESKRLLDMQRRQKERIEEVRETQKKDEEFMNMKEQLRVEIRKRLNELETRCNDMTSLLRGLGIHVGGSFIPLPNEVHAAYKRALFKFHPDRASKTDIREQVEAEEKFKLISRMKEKFLLTSCH